MAVTPRMKLAPRRALMLLAAIAAVAGPPRIGRGHDTPIDLKRDVGFDQKLEADIPGALEFRDASGKRVALGTFFAGKPLILALVYYDCPNLCPLVLDGLVRGLKPLSWDAGKEFEVLAVSIDPTEGPQIAAAKKRDYLSRYGRAGADGGWHFLTGEKESIEALSRAIGFRYAYDAAKRQYIHPSGLVLLTPGGRVARYFYGIEYAPRDIRLGLMEASSGRIGTPLDQALLFCYEYDPVTGKYSLVVMRAIQAAGFATVLALGSFLFVALRRERREKARGRDETREGPPAR